jgi:hypothetical protein
MAMFLLHIAFLLALALFAAGIVLWHRGGQPTAGVLRIGGGIVMVGAVLSALCIAYYGIRYQVQGDFDRVYPAHPPMDMGHMMGGGMMGRGMMGHEAERGSMDRPEMPREMPRAPEAGPSESEHEAHHPEGAATP